jgi:hypothetical protein
MDEHNLSKNQKVILYLIDRLGDHVGGRKKLVKLMFLIEHYDPDLGKLTKEQFLGNDFIIYRYGVFSSEVMEDYLELNRMDIVQDYPIELLKNPSSNLDERTKSRVDSIVDLFKEREAYSLENFTLKLLGLNKETKMRHFEEDVIPLINRKHKRLSLSTIHSLF